MNPTVELLTPEVLELVRERRLGELRAALRQLDRADVAELLSMFDATDAAVAFRFLPRAEAADVFSYLETDAQEALIHELGAEGVRVVEAMDPDDRAALIEELPASVTTRLLNAMSPANRRETQEILNYAEESVGRLLTPDYVRVRPDWTAERALAHIRHWGRDAETVNWVYVIDSAGRLVDDIRLRSILLAEPETTIESLMDDRFVALRASDDQEQAVRDFAKYDRTALPVVDDDGVLLGILTFDDVADVAAEEAEEDFQKLAGMERLEKSYMATRLWEMVRKRGGVLLILLAAQSLTIGVLGAFEEKLAAAEILILFIPLIVASGGNTGTQTASLLIRALALGELTPGDWWRVVRKELFTGIGLGLGLGLVGAASVLVWELTPTVGPDADLWVALTVGVSVLGIAVWAVLLGALLPLLLEKIGADPASISSPLVATMMDVSGLVIYLVVATVVLL